MAMPVEMTEEIPPAAATTEQADDVTLYGVQIARLRRTAGAATVVRYRRRLRFGRSSMDSVFRATAIAWRSRPPSTSVASPVPPAVGCGYDGIASYRSWTIEKEDRMVRIERRKGTAEELILDFNLPGRSPATLTYSAKVQIATKAGKVYE